jgi:hypothetical protein
MKASYFIPVFLVATTVLNGFCASQARTINSAMYFKGTYQNKTIYGTLNSWDQRACSIMGGKVVLGKVGANGNINFSGKRVKVLEQMLLNPVGYNSIPNTWRKKTGFSKCMDETLYARCFIRAGTDYYKSDDENFRRSITSKTNVFSLGEETNSYDRGKTVSAWASFSFTKNGEGENYLVDSKDLVCNAKS